MSSSDLRNGEVGCVPELPTTGSEERTTGILPSQAIRELIAKGANHRQPHQSPKNRSTGEP